VNLHPESDRALQEIRAQAKGAKRIVFVSGNFNVVHPGHLRLLRFAADCGDFLVVGVLDSMSKGAIVQEDLRLEGIKSISLVDFAFTLRDPPEQFISELQPSMVVKGKEHEDNVNLEQTAVDAYGGKLLFSSGEMSFSSLDLLKREFIESNLSTVVMPKDFPLRHRFTKADLKDVLGRFNSLRVMVVGDLIVDEYINCDPLGMSQEDPTIVVTPIRTDRFLGGAGIVAAHARGLGAKVSYFSVAGQDEARQFANEKLNSMGVAVEVLEDASRPTTLKQRYRAGGKTLLRVSHLRQHAINRELITDLSRRIGDRLDETDLLIFSDFNYGCLPQVLVDQIAANCRRHGVMMVADSQSSSQVGDISRFRDMELVTPTEREARLAVRDFDVGLVVLSEHLRARSGAKNVILTLGTEGLLVYAPLADGENWHTDKLPAFNTAPKDPAGAGDSLLTCSAMALAVGANIWEGSFLGSLAAALQVGRVGNAPLAPEELRAEIDNL
jgi:rfaE bifunctional protein kinase chain/domain